VISVEVRADPRRYDVLIEAGLLASAGEFVKKRLRGPRCALISDSNIAPLFGDRVKQSLLSVGFQPTPRASNRRRLSKRARFAIR